MIHNPLTAERPLYPPSRAAGAPKQIQLNPTITALVLLSEHWKGYTAGSVEHNISFVTLLFCTFVVLYGAALVAQEGGLMDWYDIARYWYGCGYWYWTSVIVLVR